MRAGPREGLLMVISSRTPEGEPGRCPICGASFRVEPSEPPGDAPCPSCGHLVWFTADEVVLRLDSRVAVETIARIASSIEAGPKRRIVFDFDRVEWLDSRALAALIALKTRLQGQRRGLTLRHVRPDLREVFRITRLDHVFCIEA